MPSLRRHPEISIHLLLQTIQAMHSDLFDKVLNILCDHYDIPEVWIYILDNWQNEESYVPTPEEEELDYDYEVLDLPDNFWESE